MRASRISGSLVAAALALSSVGAGARTVPVVIDKMRFGPVPAGLKKGDTIVWQNRDLFRHTATARDGSFNVDLPAGASGRTVLRRSGQFAFFCRYHPGMTGRLAVGQ